MPVAYRLADVFVLSSQGPSETWGLAINEAMACGRLVVASSKCGGATDLIDNGGNGLYHRTSSGVIYRHPSAVTKRKISAGQL
jgi:glycosyltransferase involved in cell wall biosynthesis